MSQSPGTAPTLKAGAIGFVDALAIVVGTHGESPLRGATVGSTPYELLHLSDRPVLCVPILDTGHEL